MANSAERSLELFHRAAEKIPAYKAFIEAAGIKPSDIKAVEDLAKVPVTNKKTYLVPNKLEDLVWPSNLDDLLLFCSTSGSTGEPYYFPRSEQLSEQYSHLIEDYLKASSYGNGRTLVIIAFGMGVWIGGIITLRAFEIAGQRINSPVALLPTGYNKNELFKALRKLAPNFDQTVIVGYPPFIKEVVDEAEAEAVDLSKLHVRFLFAAEAFTETFRNYVCEKAGVGNPLLDTLNIYGTADIGAMAFETPVSILIRRLAIEDPLLLKDMFNQIEKTPTLAQYDPAFMHFETVNGEIVLTGDSALPLLRYAVGDNGGTMTYDQVKHLLKRYNIDLEAEIDKAGIRDAVKQWPFVFVYERTDFSTTVHGINIYPEFIKEGLLHPKVTDFFTERFTMSTKHDIHHNQFLQINIELQKDLEPSPELEQKALKYIQHSLITKSSEFAEVSKSRASSSLLQVVLWPNGHPRYFAPGTKQRWVEKVV